MKKVALAALAAAGLFAAAGAAQAKEVMGLKVCGPAGCKEADPQALKGWMVDGTPVEVGLAAPAAYYNVEVAIGDGGTIRGRAPAVYLPGSDLMRIEDNSWWKVSPNQGEVLHALASGLTPFTPALTSVTVGGKKVTDPSSYLRLFGKLPWGYAYPKTPGMKIVLRSPQPNPWMGRVERMSYVAKTRILVRDDGTFRLPKALGRQIMRRASLAAVPGAGPHATAGSGHTALYAGIGAAGFAAVALALGVARRKARDS
jgi:hypothetical protein